MILQDNPEIQIDVKAPDFWTVKPNLTNNKCIEGKINLPAGCILPTGLQGWDICKAHFLTIKEETEVDDH